MKLIDWDITRLEELVELWNEELACNFPMRKELFEQNSFTDVNLFVEGSCIAVNDKNKIVGFVVAKKWQDEINVGISPSVGNIQVLVVSQKYRNQGIGTALLQHAESKLKESGIKDIWLGKDTWHYFPGIPSQFEQTLKWFEQRGYKHSGTEVDLDCHYGDDDLQSLPSSHDVEISLLNLDEKDDFLSFLHRCFPGRWEYEAIQYFQLGGTGREFVVMKKDGTIIGFCRINDSKSPFIAQNVNWAPLYQEEQGGIGPLGVDSNFRKNGYGLLVVEAAVAYLRKRNIKSIVIDWTGLVAFYNKLGFEVCKRYETFVKKL